MADKASLHLRLPESWGERPDRGDAYSWRWLAFHRAQAAIASEQPKRHDLAEKLVTIVTDADWQRLHENAVKDLPALRDALSYALDAAVADDVPLGVVQASDALVRFRRDHLRPEPIFNLARRGATSCCKVG